MIQRSWLKYAMMVTNSADSQDIGYDVRTVIMEIDTIFTMAIDGLVNHCELSWIS